jgi:putative heme-binding domain-containing protein
MRQKAKSPPHAASCATKSKEKVLLKDGGEIHGLALSAKDPVIIQSQGGTVQMIPANKVKKVEPLGRSLMLSADQLGLSAQDVADLMAYLKGLN